MSTVLLSGIYAALVILVIAVHEAGHFLAGRLGGVPSAKMRIRLLRLPPHVALASGDRWVGPRDGTEYARVMQEYLGGIALFRFTAGGLVLQSIFAVSGFVLLRISGVPGIGWMLVSYSAAMVAFYLVIDPLMKLLTGRVTGDITALFAISPVRAVVTLAVIVLVHAVILVAFF